MTGRIPPTLLAELEVGKVGAAIGPGGLVGLRTISVHEHHRWPIGLRKAVPDPILIAERLGVVLALVAAVDAHAGRVCYCGETGDEGVGARFAYGCDVEHDVGLDGRGGR